MPGTLIPGAFPFNFPSIKQGPQKILLHDLQLTGDMIQVKCFALKGKQMKPLTGRDNDNNTVLKIMTKKLNDFATKLLSLCIRYLKKMIGIFLN